VFTKHYSVDPKHIDFQNVMDGIFYPFYMEWCRHDFISNQLGVNIEQLFEMGHQCVIVEYTLRFRKPVKRGDMMEVNCVMEPSDKRTRVNFVQQIKVDGHVCAEATFACTVLANGRPSIPAAWLENLQRA